MGGYEDLLRWAKGQGVELHGITPFKTATSDTGMVTTRTLQKGDPVLVVPARAIRSVKTIPESVSRKMPPDTPLHGLLAAELARDTQAELAIWRKLLPTRASFSATLPFMWPDVLQDLLPAAAGEILKRQQAKFQREWDIAAGAFPDLRREDYLHSWFVIGTRTFLHEIPETERYAWEDRLALLPVADLFNHANDGCHVWAAEEGFTIAADRAYNPGEEIFISYGEHSNDFLLAEYGFLMANNRCDKVCLDEEIMPRLHGSQKKELDARGLLGKYTLGLNGPCRRTQVVLRILSCSHEHWLVYVDGTDDGQTSQKAADALLAQILENFLNTIREKLNKLEKLQAGGTVQRETLKKRWRQIRALVEQTNRQLLK